MEKTHNRSIGRRIFALCPAGHSCLIFALLLIAFHILCRRYETLCSAVYLGFARPFHRAMALLLDRISSFALAELLIYLALAAAVLALVLALWRIFTRGEKLRRCYSLAVWLLAAACGLFAGYSIFWGSYYYADDFARRNGFEAHDISTEELETVTSYFASLLNSYGRQVERDEDGFYVLDKEALLEGSASLYDRSAQLHPGLEGPRARAKAIASSRLMSYIDFTGFFFPFTGEACVNTDFPPSQFPATVAHELAHQRGAAREQDANFCAVLVCLENGQTDYCYSASMLAYIHLGNALYSADREAWQRVYGSLEEGPLKDMARYAAYWRQFESPVQTVSNRVYESFLQSYDQQLGRRSYGACVDSLVCWYLEDARAYLGK